MKRLAILPTALAAALPWLAAAQTAPAATPSAQSQPSQAQQGQAQPSQTQRPPQQRASSPAAQPFGQPAAQNRLSPTINQPLGLGHQSTPAPRGAELAPTPNRDIEAPRDRFADSRAATLEPMILPPERRTGVTFGREHFRETGPDRPFDHVLPGARLRIPFEGGGSGR
jgi:hypothetical protein